MLRLPGWLGALGMSQSPSHECFLWGLSAHQRKQVFVDKKQVVHFAWGSSPGPWAQASVLGCKGVLRTEVIKTHDHGAWWVLEFRKCLRHKTMGEAQHPSEGSATTKSAVGCGSKIPTERKTVFKLDGTNSQRANVGK